VEEEMQKVLEEYIRKAYASQSLAPRKTGQKRLRLVAAAWHGRRVLPIFLWFRRMKLFVLFAGFTLAELSLLILLTRATSLGFTILVTLVTAALGATLALHQGLRVVRQIGEELSRAQIPARPLAEAVLVLLGGALLIPPDSLRTDWAIDAYSAIAAALYAQCCCVVSGKSARQAAKSFAGGRGGWSGVRIFSFSNGGGAAPNA
jgi:uncharacterized membrane protein YgcG